MSLHCFCPHCGAASAFVSGESIHCPHCRQSFLSALPGTPLPMAQDYNEAIQHPASCFSDPELKGGHAVCNPGGFPLPCSGNFADVYQVRGSDGTPWAAKCFTRRVAGLRERYAAVSDHLRRAGLPFTVDFHYLEQGIRVRGQWHPVVKMRWVEGLTLNQFVRDFLDRPELLDVLRGLWQRRTRRLRAAGIAHGDLQHGNILLVPGQPATRLHLRLIDYDGMWVPALADRPCGEVGHPAYQHPQRLSEQTYGPEVDRFPVLLVATALACLKVGGRPLWEKYDNGDNLLFRETDLKAPTKSPLFYDLLQMADPLARKLVGHTLDALRGRLKAVPLLDEVLSEHPITALADSGTTAAVVDHCPAPPAPGPVTLPPGARPRLLVFHGRKCNVEYPIYSGFNFIGRADEKAVTIDLEDQEPLDCVWCSRQHACIRFEADQLSIEDLNSSNGTYVNRTRIYPGQKRPLAPNDVIQIGNVQMKVVV